MNKNLQTIHSIACSGFALVCTLQLNTDDPVTNQTRSRGVATPPLIRYSDVLKANSIVQQQSKKYLKRQKNHNSRNNLQELPDQHTNHQSQDISSINFFILPSISYILKKTPLLYISCGIQHCAAISQNGRILTWGNGGSGCLGHGNYLSYPHPKQIQTLFNKQATYIQCGGYHTAAIMSTLNEAFIWGRGDIGQLGLPRAALADDQMGTIALHPTKLFINNVASIALGEAHTLVLNKQGKVLVSGWGDMGQLGLGDTVRNVQQFTQVPIADNAKIGKIVAGCVFSGALDVDNKTIYLWGSNMQGQLGCGNQKKYSSKPSPVLIIKEVSRNDDEYHNNHRHHHHQIGKKRRDTSTQIFQEKAIDFMAGESNIFAMCQSGRVYGWGQGVTGQSFQYGDIDDSQALSNQSGQIDQFAQKSKYKKGTHIICYYPQELYQFDVTQRIVIKEEQDSSNSKPLKKKKSIKTVSKVYNSQETKKKTQRDISTKINNNTTNSSKTSQYHHRRKASQDRLKKSTDQSITPRRQLSKSIDKSQINNRHKQATMPKFKMALTKPTPQKILSNQVKKNGVMSAPGSPLNHNKFQNPLSSSSSSNYRGQNNKNFILEINESENLSQFQNHDDQVISSSHCPTQQSSIKKSNHVSSTRSFIQERVFSPINKSLNCTPSKASKKVDDSARSNNFGKNKNSYSFVLPKTIGSLNQKKLALKNIQPKLKSRLNGEQSNNKKSSMKSVIGNNSKRVIQPQQQHLHQIKETKTKRNNGSKISQSIFTNTSGGLRVQKLREHKKQILSQLHVIPDNIRSHTSNSLFAADILPSSLMMHSSRGQTAKIQDKKNSDIRKRVNSINTSPPLQMAKNVSNPKSKNNKMIGRIFSNISKTNKGQINKFCQHSSSNKSTIAFDYQQDPINVSEFINSKNQFFKQSCNSTSSRAMLEDEELKRNFATPQNQNNVFEERRVTNTNSLVTSPLHSTQKESYQNNSMLRRINNNTPSSTTSSMIKKPIKVGGDLINMISEHRNKDMNKIVNSIQQNIEKIKKKLNKKSKVEQLSVVLRKLPNRKNHLYNYSKHNYSSANVEQEEEQGKEEHLQINQLEKQE